MNVDVLLIVIGLVILAAGSFWLVRRILRSTPSNNGPNSLRVFGIGAYFGNANTDKTREEQSRSLGNWLDRFAYAPLSRKLLIVTLCSGSFTGMFKLFSETPHPGLMYEDTSLLRILVICPLLWLPFFLVLASGRRLDQLKYDLTPAAKAGWWAVFIIELSAMLAVAFRV